MRSIRSLLVAAALFVGPASLSAQDAQSRLWDAAVAGDTAAIRQAVGDGALVDSLDTRTNANGRHALNWAALNDRVDAIRLLLELGAPLDGRNRTGFTALHHAAEVNSVEAARVLLEMGASTTILNQQGMTPLDVARDRSSRGVARLLEADAAAD